MPLPGVTQMADYCTLQEVKNQIPESGLKDSTDYDLLIGGLITACSRLIDREVGRHDGYFYATTSTVRTYDGNGNVRMWIDDAVSVTKLEVSEVGGLNTTDFSEWSASDWYVHPYNDSPKRAIIIDRLNGAETSFPRYRKNIKVTGVFGHSATPPAQVRQACLIQVIRWYMRSKQAYADSGASPEVGQMTVNVGGRAAQPQLDSDVRLLLAPFIMASSIGVDDD